VELVSVSAVIVTRGDVNLDRILDSLRDYERIVWDNSRRMVGILQSGARGDEPLSWTVAHGIDDVAVYGRYAAIAEAKHPLIFAQDDDIVLPRESIEEIIRASDSGAAAYGQLVVNMPQNFRHSFYQEHALIGFGSCFHRDLPERAFARFRSSLVSSTYFTIPDSAQNGFTCRTCDVVFTTLTPYVMVDVPYEQLPWSDDDNRMWRQPTHREERQRMLDLARQVRDS